MDHELYFSLDVETLGLLGPVTSVGYCVGQPTDTGKTRIVEEGVFWRKPTRSELDLVSDQDVEWWAQNTPDFVTGTFPSLPEPIQCPDIETVYDQFWSAWARRVGEARMICDVPWPGESRFLLGVLDRQIQKGRVAARGGAPYPILDVATVRYCAGLNPIAVEDRLSTELPRHHPLADARQSLRLFLEALEAINQRRPR